MKSEIQFEISAEITGETKSETGFLPQTLQPITPKRYQNAMRTQVSGSSMATLLRDGGRNQIPFYGFMGSPDAARQFSVQPSLRASPEPPPGLNHSSSSTSAPQMKGCSRLTAWSAHLSGS
jgi:hypothetical protein